MVAGVRLDPHLDVDEAVRAHHEIPKSVETNAGQSHEHTRAWPASVSLIPCALGSALAQRDQRIFFFASWSQELGAAVLHDSRKELHYQSRSCGGRRPVFLKTYSSRSFCSSGVRGP